MRFSHANLRHSLLLFSRTLGLGGEESLLRFLPIDDLPDVCKVLGPRVLVVQVVSVFPNVNADDRHKIWADIRHWVLVVRFTVRKNIGAFVIDEPAPAGAHDIGSTMIELALELIDGSPRLDQGIVEGSSFWQTAISRWAERVPEERVVDVATTVEVQRFLQRYEFLDIASGQCLGLHLHQLVQVRDIHPMVSAIMEVNDLTTHDGLEGSHLPRKVL